MGVPKKKNVTSIAYLPESSEASSRQLSQRLVAVVVAIEMKRDQMTIKAIKVVRFYNVMYLITV